MKQIVDFIAWIVFFIVYKLYDIYVASVTLIIATGIGLIVHWIMYRKLEKIPIFIFFLVTIFSSLTWFLHNDEFIKWKVTIIYLILSVALLYSQFFMKHPLIQTMLYKELELPRNIWYRLNIAWAIYFLICSITNIYVAFYFSQEFWVNFKVFGLTGFTLLFTFFSGLYIWGNISK